MIEYQNLFQPVKIGNCEIKNRFAMAPLGPLGMSDPEGGWSQRGIDYYTARARGGVGLIHTGITFVDNDVEKHAVGNCPCSTHNPAHFIRTSAEMNERIHAYGAKVFLQMTGGLGRVTVPKASGFYPPVAPSPVLHRWKDVVCRELTLSEIHTLVRRFGEGAGYAQAAGFDGIQIHAVHEGYLLDQFAIALFNNRTDEYGGNLENRLRIVKEILEEIRKNCGDNFPVTMRFSLKSFIKGLRVGALPGEVFEEIGRDTAEGVEAAKLLVKYGYAALDVDVGSYDAWWWSHPPMYQEKGLYIPYCRVVKEAVDVPVICAGRMDDPELASGALESGACDIVSLGRPLLADPEYVNKLRSGKIISIRPCLSCQEGCMGRIGKYSALSCAVNPACGRESTMDLVPAVQKKKVLIVGGGPAGCEAARVLKLRGHNPVLYEAGDSLGGNLLSGGVPDFKQDDLALARWYENELEELGVSVRLNTTVTPNDLFKEESDAIIVATGGLPRNPFKDDMVCTAAQALLGERICGDRVIVYGGGTVACETALWCKKNGKEVTIVYRGEEILINSHPLCHANSDMLKELVYYNGVRVIKRAVVSNAENSRVKIRTEEGEHTLQADTLVLAIGYDPNRTLYDALAALNKEVYLVGDANRVSNIMYAIWDAYEVARNL